MNIIKKHFLTIIAIAGMISMPIFQLQGSTEQKKQEKPESYRARVRRHAQEFYKSPKEYLYKHRYKIGTGVVTLGGAAALFYHRERWMPRLQEYTQPHYERGKAYLYSFTPTGKRELAAKTLEQAVSLEKSRTAEIKWEDVKRGLEEGTKMRAEREKEALTEKAQTAYQQNVEMKKQQELAQEEAEKPIEQLINEKNQEYRSTDEKSLNKIRAMAKEIQKEQPEMAYSDAFSTAYYRLKQDDPEMQQLLETEVKLLDEIRALKRQLPSYRQD